MCAMGDILFVSRSARNSFSNPVEIIRADALADVPHCLQRIAAGVGSGLHAAGFISYEAAGAFDPVMKTRAPGGLPLLWFGLYSGPREPPPDIGFAGAFETGPWTALVTPDEYRARVEDVRRLIADGETYQVNYTFPMQTVFRGDTCAWFERLCSAQRADYAVSVDVGRHHILSASPELFFRLDGESLETRPMKGTRSRGRWPAEDRQAAAELRESAKDRAENIMIVDLLRNDMGRISEPGSVRVGKLYEVERYPTVWQMTSSVFSRTSAGVPEIIEALFPCGSVTGAPKIRTMEIIRHIEPHPRGVYCGSIGWWAPGRRAEFNVAIRTVVVDRDAGLASYHVGGGITSGSSPEDEYSECLAKARLLARREQDHELLESLLFDGGYFLLAAHMRRLSESADYFGYDMDLAAIESALTEKGRALLSGGGAPHKVRLLVAANGSFRIEAAPTRPTDSVRLGFAANPVDRNDIFLFHKTTCRAVYEEALASRPDCGDVLLWNGEDEITESAMANVVLEMDGELVTPPVGSGLLPGTFRQQLLDRGEIRERVLMKADVRRASSIRLVNSVRKWIPVEWAG